MGVEAFFTLRGEFMGRKKLEYYCPGKCSGSLGTKGLIRTEDAEHMVARYDMPQELGDKLKMKTIYRCGYCERAWIEENGSQRVIGAREMGAAKWTWKGYS
jgi:hypothetical protein